MRPSQPHTKPQTDYHSTYQKIVQIRDDIKDCLTTADGETKYKDKLDNFNEQLSDLWGQLPPGYLQTDFPAACKERSYLEMAMKHGETTQGDTGMSVDSIRSQLLSLCWTILLPGDILVHIFKQGTFCSPPTKRSCLMKYASVCKHWRNQALLAPFLWGLIEFRDQKPPFRLTKLFLKRSKSAPLIIGITTTNPWFDCHGNPKRWPRAKEMSARLAVLVPHAHRWKKFSCYTDHWNHMRATLRALHNLATPILTTLQLQQHWDVSHIPDRRQQDPIMVLRGGAPTLQELSFWNIVRIEWHNMAFTNLSELMLNHLMENETPSFRDFWSMLYHSPNLQTLSLIGHGPPMDFEAASKLARVKLLSLRELTFVGTSYEVLGYPPEIAYSLDYVLFILSSFQPGPALHSLHIGGFEPEADVLRAVHVLRDFAHVKRLLLSCINFTAETAAQWLVEMPQLHHLGIKIHSKTQSAIIQALVAEPSPHWDVLCPSLTTFGPLFLEFGEISDLVTKRLDHGVGLKALVFSTWAEEEIMEMNLDELMRKVKFCFEVWHRPWEGLYLSDSDATDSDTESVDSDADSMASANAMADADAADWDTSDAMDSDTTDSDAMGSDIMDSDAMEE